MLCVNADSDEIKNVTGRELDIENERIENIDSYIEKIYFKEQKKINKRKREEIKIRNKFKMKENNSFNYRSLLRKKCKKLSSKINNKYKKLREKEEIDKFIIPSNLCSNEKEKYIKDEYEEDDYDEYKENDYDEYNEDDYEEELYEKEEINNNDENEYEKIYIIEQKKKVKRKGDGMKINNKPKNKNFLNQKNKMQANKKKNIIIRKALEKMKEEEIYGNEMNNFVIPTFGLNEDEKCHNNNEDVEIIEEEEENYENEIDDIKNTEFSYYENEKLYLSTQMNKEKRKKIQNQKFKKVFRNKSKTIKYNRRMKEEKKKNEINRKRIQKLKEEVEYDNTKNYIIPGYDEELDEFDEYTTKICNNLNKKKKNDSETDDNDDSCSIFDIDDIDDMLDNDMFDDDMFDDDMYDDCYYLDNNYNEENYYIDNEEEIYITGCSIF